MSNYIPRSGGQKKKNLLHQKELALRGEIRRGATSEKLEGFAEKVRLAQLGVIKALIHEAEPCRAEDEERARRTLDHLGEVKVYWESISIEEMIDHYSAESEESPMIDRKRWWDMRPR